LGRGKQGSKLIRNKRSRKGVQAALVAASAFPRESPPPPLANSFVIGTAVINTHTLTSLHSKNLYRV
jgi:hypothetical protein